jgi:hypothetical protein
VNGVNREDAATLVAIEVHRRAPAGPIDFGLVYATIAELAEHGDDCRCGTCDAARRARPVQVWRLVSRWACGIADTRARARR